MNNTIFEIKELVSEIRNLQKKNQNLLIENNFLKNELNMKKYQLEQTKNEVNDLKKRLNSANEELNVMNKHVDMKIKKLENEIRKNDLFNETFKGSSKTRQEEMIRNKIKFLKNTNQVLKDLIDLFAKNFSFDEEICKSICDISTGINDNNLKNFLDEILKNNSNLKHS